MRLVKNKTKRDCYLPRYVILQKIMRNQSLVAKLAKIILELEGPETSS